MKEQVLLYEIKKTADSNSNELFHPRKPYFYWNQKRFRELNVNDYAFVVNVHSGFILRTRIDKKNIQISYDETKDESSFEDEGHIFKVKGKWDDFIRMRIIKNQKIPENWHWKSLGIAETTYLNGRNINKERSKNRIKNIEQLKEIFTDDESLNILDACLENFRDQTTDEKKNNTKNIIVEKYDNILTAIKTKPFIILAGFSGTGKSRLVRTLAFKTCPTELRSNPGKPGNFEIIPVRPDWHDSSELMGYISRISGEKYVTTPFLHFIAKAWKHIDTPFFLCMDEMNLAPVEQYFAEYLSIIETRQKTDNRIVTDHILSKESIGEKLYKEVKDDLGLNLDQKTLQDLGLEEIDFKEGFGLPENLIIMGTVNMDETTHSFSRKVLDRAMTFEMNEFNLDWGLEEESDDWDYPPEDQLIRPEEVIGEYTTGKEVYSLESYPKEIKNKVLLFLKKLNGHLEGTPFQVAYRVRDEFLIYCYYASQKEHKPDNWLDIALDEMTVMKVLSRIEGDTTRTRDLIDKLKNFLTENHPKSYAKLEEMSNRLDKSSYTSFWA